jgi:hypothetical protein
MMDGPRYNRGLNELHPARAASVILSRLVPWMGNDQHSNETTDTVLNQEQIDELARQLRAACLAALNSGRARDVEAILRANLPMRGSHLPPQTEVLPTTRDDEPSPKDAIPVLDQQAVAMTITFPPTDTARGPAGPRATLARCGDYQNAARGAEHLFERSSREANNLIEAACCFAICSDMMARPGSGTSSVAANSGSCEGTRAWSLLSR